MLLDLAKAWMIPFPPFGWVFHCGGLGCCLVCCGVGGFVLGVVVTVGYRPTGSSDWGKQTPFPGAPTQAPNTHAKTKFHKPTAIIST